MLGGVLKDARSLTQLHVEGTLTWSGRKLIITASIILLLYTEMKY